MWHIQRDYRAFKKRRSMFLNTVSFHPCWVCHGQCSHTQGKSMRWRAKLWGLLGRAAAMSWHYRQELWLITWSLKDSSETCTMTTHVSIAGQLIRRMNGDRVSMSKVEKIRVLSPEALEIQSLNCKRVWERRASPFFFFFITIIL